MNVLLFGATGMIGRAALLESLRDGRVRSVLAVGRRPTGVTDSKLRDVVVEDLFDLSAVKDELPACDACFYCLGAASYGMTEAEYSRLTYDLTLSVASSIAAVNTRIAFCFISGDGADPSERGRTMWARVKGKTENALLRMPFRAFIFRPGYIQPLDGIRTRVTHYRILYAALRPFYGLLRRLSPRHVTDTRRVGRALVAVGLAGHEKRILGCEEINALGER
ncbi:MAG TPA: NAD-dependent epimerase/dehydratase family protein [Candidatus Polarisedimenticolaceae bacterium]|nr:NAD-dependent epimerase/dehydratase family protein [Candidatus Polarisedimenticolaceae bacterium]